jgi:hypothetical protein
VLHRYNGGKLDFSPKGLLKYISSMGLEAYETLVIALQILMTSQFQKHHVSVLLAK